MKYLNPVSILIEIGLQMFKDFYFLSCQTLPPPPPPLVNDNEHSMAIKGPLRKTDKIFNEDQG